MSHTIFTKINQTSQIDEGVKAMDTDIDFDRNAVSDVEPVNSIALSKESYNRSAPSHTGIFYHIVSDTNINIIDKINDAQKLSSFIFGSLRKVGVDDLPVLFDKTEVNHIGGRICASIIENGGTQCAGENKCKCYPIFGVVALGFRFKEPVTRSELGDIMNSQNGTRDYEKLRNGSGDISTYIVNGKQRGIVHKRGFSKLEFVEASLITTTYNKDTNVSQDIKIDKHTGFAILSTVHHLSHDNIRLLLKLHQNKNSFVLINDKVIQEINNKPQENLQNIIMIAENAEYNSELPQQRGMSEDLDYEKLYRAEKAGYINSRGMTTDVSETTQGDTRFAQMGGNLSEEDYERLYISEKKKYLRSKLKRT